MISISSAKQKFAEILSSTTAWKPLASSQFVEHLSVFVSWCLRSAQFSTERNRQEAYASTAINPSSIMAHAEDREYLPIKASPSKGAITVENIGEHTFSLPIHTEFSTEDDIPIVTLQAVKIAAGGKVVIPVAQKTLVERLFKVSEGISFYSVMLPVEDTAHISSFNVMVKEDGHLPFENWAYARLLTNTNSKSKVYDQFYSHTDQFGVRFGNGTFGKIPSVGSEILVKCWLTQGELFLSAGQEVFTVKELPVEIVATISTAITGGNSAEGIESIRKSLHYWQIYDDKLVWDDDYPFFLNRVVPTMTFINVWGEAEMEKQAGAPSVEYINKIFFSAYAPDIDAPNLCLAALKEKHSAPLNKFFKHIPVVHKYFRLTITGKVLPDVIIDDAEEEVKRALLTAYGKDSATRRKNVLWNELVEVVQKTGFFEEGSGASFQMTPSGSLTPEELQDMVSIDIENTTVELEYL